MLANAVLYGVEVRGSLRSSTDASAVAAIMRYQINSLIDIRLGCFVLAGRQQKVGVSNSEHMLCIFLDKPQYR